MKRIITIVMFFLFFLLANNLIWAQLLIENFKYTAGTNLTANGWTAYASGGTNPVTVSSSGLSYAGYPSSGIGNAALLDNTGEAVYRNFTAQTSGSVYVSFLVNIATAPTSDYFLHLGQQSVGGGDIRARVYTRTVGGNLRFGVSKNTNIIYSNTDYSFNTTYLLVLKYTFLTQNGNDDQVRLYIFSAPTLPSTEPGTATIGPVTQGGNSDLTSLGTVALRQYNASQNITVDGIRVATSWSDSPLPVELASFSAVPGDKKITLNWVTESEVNNMQFDILRALSSKGEYLTVGIVEGQFNTNQRTEYSFTDDDVTNGNTYWYKLVDVDINGVRTEHGPVVATPGVPEGLVPDQFKLYQNYPNPFNPSTTLKLYVPGNLSESSSVKVEIFNVLGQKVRTLFDGNFSAGVHALTWNGESDQGYAVPGGIYFAVLSAGTYTDHIKMVLLK